MAVISRRRVADPDRLGIGGASHGGFMAAWAIGQTDRFKAALMAAGISDWGMLVATGEGGTLDAALSWYGAEHELVIYPREGHGLVERNHQLDLLRRTRAWFDRWLRDEASDARGSPALRGASGGPTAGQQQRLPSF